MSENRKADAGGKRAGKVTNPKEKAGVASRIVGKPVAPLIPQDGSVFVLLVGEAPGPRGADKSGIPFFGDGAGKHLYAALRELGAVHLPEVIDGLPWDGAVFAEQGVKPTSDGIALGNAYDRCPTDDGSSFRAPTRSELTSAANVSRIDGEIDMLVARGLHGIVTMGRVAATTIDFVLRGSPRPQLVRRAVVHPSARGLLSTVRGKAGVSTMAELQNVWKKQCQDAIREAGYEL